MSGLVVDGARIRQWAREQLPVLRRWGRAAPAGIGLAVAWSATSLTALLSFVLILLPKTQWEVLGFREDDAPINRAVCFCLCVFWFWCAGAAAEALGLWWSRLQAPDETVAERVPDLGFRHALLLRALKSLYVIAFKVTAAILGVLVYARALIDPAFGPAVKKVLSMIAGYLGAAGGIFTREIDLMPTIPRFAAVLLFISFVVYACGLGLVRYVRSEVR